MTRTAPYDYKVVPAPRAARRIKGARGAQERFARTLEEILSEEGADGWEFLRAEHLEIDEKRSWLSRAKPAHRSVLVFRRARGERMPMQAQAAPAYAPQVQPAVAPAPMPAPAPAPAEPVEMDPDAAWARSHTAPPPAPTPAAHPGPHPGFAEPAAAPLRPAAPPPPGPHAAPHPGPAQEEEPVLRLAPATREAVLRPDPEVHPDPGAPRIGPADR